MLSIGELPAALGIPVPVASILGLVVVVSSEGSPPGVLVLVGTMVGFSIEVLLILSLLLVFSLW